MAKANLIVSVVSVVFIYMLEFSNCVRQPEWTYFPNDGHVNLGKADDENRLVHLKDAFKLKDKEFKKLFISPNGAIRVSNYKRMSTTDPLTEFPKNEILVYYVDHIIDKSCSDCKFTSKINVDQTTQNKIDRIVRMSNLAGSSPMEATYTGHRARTLIVTWTKVTVYAENSLSNTFQAILTSNGKNSYIIYNYLDLQYPNENLTRKIRYGAALRVDDKNYVELPGSFDKENQPSSQLMCKSNTFVPGTWIVKAGENFDYPKHKISSKCSHCFREESWTKSFPVDDQFCASNNVTYNSTMHFEAVLCRLKGLTNLYKLRSGPCVVPTMATTANPISPTEPTQPTPTCKLNNGGCSDVCDDKTGTVYCSCVLGTLSTDNKTCDMTNYLFYGAGPYLRTMGSEKDMKTAVRFTGYVLAVAHDYEKSTIFPADFNGQSTTIIKYDLKTHTSKVIQTIAGQVGTVAMDVSKGDLYFTASGEIRRLVGVYGNSIINQLLITLTSPWSIDFHTCERIIFVTDVREKKVYALNENTQQLTTIADGLGLPSGLAVDRVNHKVYWGDAQYDVIEEANYDGSCRRTIGFTHNTQIHDMTFMNGMLYWTSSLQESHQPPNTFFLRQTNISNGTTSVFYKSTDQFLGIDAFIDITLGQSNCVSSCIPKPMSPTLAPSSVMYPYGESSGDRKLPKGHIVSMELMLSRNIPLFGKQTNKLYISNQGVVTQDKPYNVSGFQRDEPFYKDSPIIVPYGYSFSTQFAGEVYARESVNVTLTSRALMDLTKDENNKEDITMIKHLVIVTWYMVPYTVYGNNRHTFQLVIASDDQNSYVLFNYQDIPSVSDGLVGFVASINATCVSFRKVEMTNVQLMDTERIVSKLSCLNPAKPTPTTDTGPTQEPRHTGDCNVNNGGCSDTCVTIDASTVRCACTGKLNSDGKTCDYTNLLYMTMEHHLILQNPDSHKLRYLVNATHYIFASAHDFISNTIYYATWNRETNATTFYRYDLNRRTPSYLSTFTFSGHMQQMAWDQSRNMLYTTFSDGYVRLFSVVGSNLIHVDVRIPFSAPRGLVLDTCQQLLFVSDWSDGKIFSLDSLNSLKVVADGLSYPNGLTIDRLSYKLYWGDAKYDVIEEANYDGSCRRTIGFLHNLHVYSMTFLSGVLYWIDWENNAIYRTDIKTGTTLSLIKEDTIPIDINSFTNNNIVNCTVTCHQKMQNISSLQKFLPYGYGDIVIPKGHDISYKLELDKTMYIFGIPTKELYIDNRGVITAEGPYSGNAGTHPGPILIPFWWGLVSTRFVGDVFVRQTSNWTELYDSMQDFGKVGMTDMPSHIVVVTWHKVAPPDNGNSQNTFQAVLVTTIKNDTFLMYNYDHLSPPKAVVGYSLRRCNISHYSNNDTDQLSFIRRGVMKLPVCGETVKTTRRTTTWETTTRVASTSPPSGSKLYPLDNDDRVPLGDDELNGPYELPGEYPLFSNPAKEFYISNNGFLTTTPHQVDNMPSNVTTAIHLYNKDLDTSYHGSIYFRATDRADILARAYKEIHQSQNVSKDFRPLVVGIVTFLDVPTYGNVNKHTFQVVMATDLTDTYGIFIYDRLDTTGALTGYNEKNCNNYRSITSKYDSHNLVRKSNIGQPGIFVYKLSSDKCRKKIPIMPPLIYHRVNSTSMGMSAIKIDRDPKVKVEVIFLQVISGSSPSASFILTRASVSTLIYEIKYINVIMTNLTSYITQALFVTSNVKQTNAVQYGRVYLPAFTTRLSCKPVLFKQQMNQLPIIKLNSEIPVSSLSAGFTSLWLQNVGTRSFDLCYKEMFSFSGPRSITVDYIAVTDASRNMTNSTFTEIGTKLYTGLLDTSYSENERSCKTIKFKYRYHDPPYVFVTPENAYVKNSEIELIAWVSRVDKDSAVVCAKSTADEDNLRMTDIKVHYIINGDLDQCSIFKCPSNLECQLDKDGNPFCGCIKSCVGREQKKRCGSNYHTYESQCALDKFVCDVYGSNSTVNITTLYLGECKQYPFVSGKAKLKVIPSIPVVFCADISLNKYMFHDYSPMHVLLTVSWEKGFNKSIHDATASWSENVRKDGFTACALVAGRHFFGLPDSPSVHWVAYQVPPTDALESGVVSLDTWYTGARCHEIKLNVSVHYATKVLLGVEHSKLKTYKDAMTVWIERAYEPQYGNSRYVYKLCARELQNFDGLHEGIKIHYLAIHNPIPPHLSEVNQIIFPRQYFSPKQPIPTVCKTNIINHDFPHLPKPVIILTGGNISSDRGSVRSIFSTNDIAVWIEFNNDTHVTACLKAVRAGLNREEVRVQYAIFPTLCEPGWQYHDGSCFLPSQKRTYDEGVNFCKTENATLPITTSQSKDHFMVTMAGSDTTWIGYNDKLEESTWVWEDDTISNYSNWESLKPDGGAAENCAAIDSSSERRKWDDRSCSERNKIVCERGSKLFTHGCAKICKNGGVCREPTNGNFSDMSCLCPDGFGGKYCEIYVMDIPECRDAVIRDESWRLYIRGPESTPLRNESCDYRQLMSNTTWYRFKGQTMLEDKCTKAVSKCGVRYPGWLHNAHPSIYDGIVDRYTYYYQHYCGSDYGRVRVRSCGKFFVYKFTYLPYWSCDYGVCTVENTAETNSHG